MGETVGFGRVGIGERAGKGAPAEGRLQHQSGEVGKWKVFGGIASCLVWQEHEVTG